MIVAMMLCEDCGTIGPHQPPPKPTRELNEAALALGWTLSKTKGQWSRRLDLCPTCTNLRALEARARKE